MSSNHSQGSAAGSGNANNNNHGDDVRPKSPEELTFHNFVLGQSLASVTHDPRVCKT